MKPTKNRFAWFIALLAALSLIVAACGDDDGDENGAADTTAGDGEDGDGEAAGGVPECLDFEGIYALVGPESTGFENWSDATELANELGSEYGDEFPDAPLDITGPGEESGTYDTFVEFVIEGFAEERGQDAATRPDYVSSPNDNVIIEGIEGSDTSFGWVGYAFFVENQDRVATIDVAGEDGTCVTPNDDTIASGEYPMSRPLFIYVNTNKATADNAVVACFVDAYMSDDGKSQVSEAGYVELTDEAWSETVSKWEEVGAECGDGTQITVSGSSTVEPITSLVAESFSADNPDVGISVDGPGTGDGFELFCNGETDISDASRPIKDEEVEVCEGNGVEYVELQVGIDGLSVLTSQ